MVLHEFGGPLFLEKVPIPKTGPNEVLIRVKACGVGLTVQHIRDGHLGGKLPLILGHEVAGEIVEVGHNVQHFEVGEHATVYFYLNCGVCEYCRSSEEPLCPNLRGFVGAHIDGGYAEYMKVPSGNVLKIPDSISFNDACVIPDAVATSVHVVRTRAKVKPLDVVVVIGAGGGVGIHVVQMVKRFGGKVIAVDVSDEKLKKVEELGADEIINSKVYPTFDQLVEKLTNGKRADAVIDFVCTTETLETGVRSLGKKGKLVILARHPNVILGLQPRRFIAQELTVTGSRYASKVEVMEGIKMVKEGKIKAIITKKVPLEQADLLHEMLVKGEITGRAILVV